MPNTKSAAKAIRSSKRKNIHNLFWKKRIKDALKSLKKSLDIAENGDVLKSKMTIFQQMLDKASKKKVIHKNRANRLKSIYASKITAVSTQGQKPKASRKSSK